MQQALLLLIVFGIAGCASIGPGTVTRDRFDIRRRCESWKSQMLLNLVESCCGDTPVFLDVGQIISGYTLEGTLSAGGTIFSTGVVPGVPDSSVVLGPQGRYTSPADHHLRAAGGRALRALADDAGAAAGHPEPHPGRVSRRRGVAPHRADQRDPQPLRQWHARAPGRLTRSSTPCCATCVGSRPRWHRSAACSGPKAARPSS